MGVDGIAAVFTSSGLSARDYAMGHKPLGNDRLVSVLSTIRNGALANPSILGCAVDRGLCGGGIAVVRGLEELGDVSKGVCSMGSSHGTVEAMFP
jgi:hypothetical protein